MSSFHKPKIFRSLHGCVICKAKSSSSRFTDSERYSNSFNKCFLLTEERIGDICNACVLLIKRWRKLPANNTRHWAHVVDSRLGPGVKSYVKRKKQIMQKQTNVSDQHRRQRKRNAANVRKSTNSFSAALLVQGADAASSYQQFRLRYQRMLSSERRRKLQGVGRRKQTNPIRLSPGEQKRRGTLNNVLDSKLWKRTNICCGSAYQGPGFMMAIPLQSYSPCLGNKDSHHSSFYSSLSSSPTNTISDESITISPTLSVMCTRSSTRMSSYRNNYKSIDDNHNIPFDLSTNSNDSFDFNKDDNVAKSAVSTKTATLLTDPTLKISSGSTAISRLSTIERIIEEELQSLQHDHECMDDQNDETDTSTSDIVHEESFNGKISSAVEEVDDLLDEDSDLDEGFFDRNSVSPDSNVDAGLGGTSSKMILNLSKGLAGTF